MAKGVFPEKKQTSEESIDVLLKQAEEKLPQVPTVRKKLGKDGPEADVQEVNVTSGTVTVIRLTK